MVEANKPMSRIERVATFILVALLAVHIRPGRDRGERYRRERLSAFERAQKIDCSAYLPCVERETLLLFDLAGRVQRSDVEGIERAERALVETRERRARFGPPAEGDYPSLGGEGDVLEWREMAMDDLARVYAARDPATRAKIERRHVVRHP